MWTHANLWYGQLKGYDRVGIGARVQHALQLSADELGRQQLFGFRTHVAHCAQRFPSYASKLREHLGTIPRADDDFEPCDLPVWTKTDQRELFSSLNPADFDDCFLHASGGSTGIPTQFYMSRASYEWRVAVARRGYAWANAEPGRRTLFVWSDAAIQPPLRARLKASFSQWVENRSFFNCFYFDEERKRLCLQAINRRRPTALIGYAGKLVELAAFSRQHPELLTWHPATIVTAAEGLQPGQRELLEQYLGGRVFESYGSREFMLIGMESRQHCGYHLSDDNLLVEVVDEAGKPLSSGQAGRIVITDLHNDANPFIRYEIGDIGVMAPVEDASSVGIPFRRLQEVRGRSQEFVLTPDGQQLTLIYFAHNLKEFSWIEAFQVVQRSQSHLVIRVRSICPPSAEMKREIANQLRPKLGATRIEVEQVDELERRPNGKVAVLLSDLPVPGGALATNWSNA
jgi:phenylacetate-CoA ligase